MHQLVFNYQGANQELLFVGLYTWASSKKRVNDRKAFYVLFICGAVLFIVGIAFFLIASLDVNHVFQSGSDAFGDGLAYVSISIFFIYRAIDAANGTVTTPKVDRGSSKFERVRQRSDSMDLDVVNANIASNRPRSKLRQYSLLFAFAAVVCAILVGWLFGYLASSSNGPFDWNAAAVSATAFATIALAGGTFVLAFTTLESARLTRVLASIAQDDQWTRDRPSIVVIDYDLLPPDPDSGRDTPIARIRYANAGLAPAIHVTFTLVWFDSELEPVVKSESLATGKITWSNEFGSVEGPVLVRGRFDDRERTEIMVNSIDRRGRPSNAMWVQDREGGVYLEVLTLTYKVNFRDSRDRAPSLSSMSSYTSAVREGP